MKTIDNLNFNGLKAIIRVDFNVPLNDQFEVTDTTRIDAALPTIRKILSDGGMVILMSHLGRPKAGPELKYSLRHLLPVLSAKLGVEVKFATDCIGEEAKKMAQSLQKGEVLLLENLRFHKEEEKGDEEFARQLAELADVYVNDAFGTAHRAHASTTIIARFFPGKSYFGYVMANEVTSLNRVMKNPERPFTAILGGAKVSGKIEIINNLLDKVDNLLIGGGMMFTFIKARGGQTGNSLLEEELLETALKALKDAESKGVKLILPSDAIIADQFNNDAKRQTSDAYHIPEGWMGLDIGPRTVESFREIILQSRTILWNGPMGVFEMPNFAQGTIDIARAIADATDRGAFSLVGGGDSVAAVNQFNLADRISYVSTGGGAMLEYIEGKILPGVAAIEND